MMTITTTEIIGTVTVVMIIRLSFLSNNRNNVHSNLGNTTAEYGQCLHKLSLTYNNVQGIMMINDSSNDSVALRVLTSTHQISPSHTFPWCLEPMWPLSLSLSRAHARTPLSLHTVNRTVTCRWISSHHLPRPSLRQPGWQQGLSRAGDKSAHTSQETVFLHKLVHRTGPPNSSRLRCLASKMPQCSLLHLLQCNYLPNTGTPRLTLGRRVIQ